MTKKMKHSIYINIKHDLTYQLPNNTFLSPLLILSPTGIGSSANVHRSKDSSVRLLFAEIEV